LIAARLRAVPAEDDEAVNLILFEDVQSLPSPILGLEVVATCAAEYRPAALNNPSHVSRAERRQLARDEARIAAADAVDFPPQTEARPHDRPNCGVHAGRVAPAGQHRDSPYHYYTFPR